MSKDEKKLQNYLLLNRYLSSPFGFKDINDFRRLLKSEEGVSQQKKFYFTEALQTLKISEELRQKLNLYDENIQSYLIHINQKRDPPIVLKHFQYVAILLTEIYLDRYYNEFDNLRSDLTKFVLELNTKEKKTGAHTYPYPDKRFMQKLAFWSATGSGKTLIMHINMLQILKYNNRKYDNLLLITPNEGLSTQHIRDLEFSSIEHKKFEAQKTLDDWILRDPIKVIEISKIKNDVTSQDGKTVSVDSFGENNIIFVDEGHKGHSTEAQTWKNIQKKLSGKGGFTFEYSATFGEITGKEDTFNEYASSIVFDYRYKYFYEDGFGKDYNILNLKNKNEYGDEYFTGSILSLYEQKIYYKNYTSQIKPFNLEDPLMLFVGSSVSGKKSDSDVLKVVEFLARFVNEKDGFSKLINNILTDKSNLVDDNDQPLFGTKFPYLRDLIRTNTKKIEDIYEDILKVLFHVKTSKTLQFIELKSAKGEIGLRFDSEYFGVIDIGDTSTFLELVESGNIYFQIGQKSNFEQSLFHKIDKKNSPINFLIGSKKFIEGWNSYRVSSMGLLNIGKKEGAQIIQLFGRGVRLRGYDNCLKRSYVLDDESKIPTDVRIPNNLTVLETLNIFGLNANYMATFKKTLEEEGVEEYEKIILKIKPTMPYTALYVPRCSDDETDFVGSHQIVSLGQNISQIKMDLSSKIDVLESRESFKQVDSDSPVISNVIDDEILNLIDFEAVYIELLKYKDLKKYSNIYFSEEDLKKILSKRNYLILCKKEILKLSKFEELTKIEKIQEYVVQLLKSHIDKVYNYEKYHWYQKNLNYEAISQEDGSLIPKEYVFTINANAQTLIRDVRDLTNELKNFVRLNSEVSDIIYDENTSYLYERSKILDFFALNVHLFKPLIYKNSNSKDLEFIKISPVNIVESERDFIKLLDKYLEDDNKSQQFEEIYLLRNPSRKGIGFFETKNFYPDFILWTIKGNEQTITFIEPHGLQMTDPDDEKLYLYHEIKNIEAELKTKSKLNIKLNCFIISPTKCGDLKWKATKEELLDKNILFLEDGIEVVEHLFKKISQDY
ncbi:DEAD/DEAH box helicase family protein [Methanosarcina sp. 1.H.A.2.2]|uniref:DEAD/DEAH box helicase family protein n=1 Tax=Methanosarcina sp. 1.H.A.2.2 TaxID=1483601 RepID=UPI00062201B4|nr:DEAD/DEAH box helicase family protein [Methanosarcina sp. 1.H.A.2.2]KKH47544.1 restriction endonuclease subunit R [Methanosarcina sp. 1.H.A.2.2]